jgi:hypothetical protein
MNFWNQLQSQKITKEQLPQVLFKKLGQPTSEIQQNLAQELLKKISSYYFVSETEQNFTTYSLVGWVNEISERKYKEGKNKGQTYYVLKLGGAGKEILQARKELLDENKWNQVQKLAILGKNLVFSYRKWITNKQVLDFYLVGKDEELASSLLGRRKKK